MVEPYYQDANVTLYHGDCLEILAWLGADVLVTDPPYGINWKQRGTYGPDAKGTPYTYNVINGDRDSAIRDSILIKWKRPAIVFNSWHVERPKDVRSLLIWNKQGAAPGPLNAAFFTNHEEICVIGEGWRRSSPPLSSVITTREHRATATKNIGHPTPKPVSLMEILIDRCPPGVIADPFAGSGSTLIAARNLGRKAIGVELEERYCEIAACRLDQLCLDFGAVDG